MFVIVTGVGHAATKWLAMVLDRPKQGIRFEHEPLMHTSQPDWIAARMAELKSAESPFFDEYWPHIGQNLKRHRIYGDAMSWNPVALQLVNEQIKIDHVIFLVRHGVPQLHSIWNASLWNRRDRATDWLYSEYLKRYWILADRPGGIWEKWSRWQKICLWWNTNVFMLDIVRKWLPDAEIEVKRTEDLTGSVKELNRLCQSLGVVLGSQQLRRLQSRDLNRKVKGNRSPNYLWKQWTKEQQADFKRICGGSMGKLEYRIP